MHIWRLRAHAYVYYMYCCISMALRAYAKGTGFPRNPVRAPLRVSCLHTFFSSPLVPCVPQSWYFTHKTYCHEIYPSIRPLWAFQPQLLAGEPEAKALRRL